MRINLDRMRILYGSVNFILNFEFDYYIVRNMEMKTFTKT